MVEDDVSNESMDDWTSYVKLLGFHVSMIVPDLLHAYNLGVGRDVVGSILAIILRDARVFRGESLADRLVVASQGLRGFAKRHSYPLRLKKLTKSKLGIKRGQYPTLASSGYDTFVVATWLEGVLQEHVDVHGDLATLLWASNRALSLQYSAGWFLTEAEKNSIQSLGSISWTHIFPLQRVPCNTTNFFSGFDQNCIWCLMCFPPCGGEPIEILNMDGWRFLKKDWPYIWFDIRDDWSKTCTPTLAHGDPVEFSKAFWCLQCIVRRAAATPVKKKPGVPGVPIHP